MSQPKSCVRKTLMARTNMSWKGSKLARVPPPLSREALCEVYDSKLLSPWLTDDFANKGEVEDKRSD